MYPCQCPVLWLALDANDNTSDYEMESLYMDDDTNNNNIDDEKWDEDEITDDVLEASMEDWDERIARFNTVHLTGRIGNDPEARYLDDGKVVVNLSLACKRKYHFMERKFLELKTGEEETDWYGLEIWGQTAEFVAKYVDKGTRVGVVGTLQIDSWVDRESGETRNRAKVVVRDLDILESKAEADLRRSGRRGTSFYDDDDASFNPGGVGGFFGY